MTKRKHSKMIKAWADNDELVVFSIRSGGAWRACGNFPSWLEDRNYFICLPQHKEACLHWLNGGEIQWSDDINEWSDKASYADDLESQEFFSGNAFMLDDNKFRIKPSKEKRWIIAKSSALASMMYFSDYQSALILTKDADSSFFGGQLVEIEVEV
jgi:hypothetical protein